MAVIHISRKTKLLRKSISSANLLCAKYPNREDLHSSIWSIVASIPTKEFTLDTLEYAFRLSLAKR
jgi:hypothetical protein